MSEQVDPEIIKALKNELDKSKRTVYRRIKDVREEFNYTVDKSQAANILASRKGIDISDILNQEEVEEVRHLDMGQQTQKVVKKEVSSDGNNSTSGTSSETLPKRILDRELYKRCGPQFENGRYQSAVRDAFLVLEERVRVEGGFSNSDHGTDMITAAFHYDNGPLSFGETESERQGLMNLYRSAFQTFRNPSSHRFLEDMDEKQAFNIICFVNSLLMMIERNNNED